MRNTHELELLPGKKETNSTMYSDHVAGICHSFQHWCPGCDAGIYEKCMVKLKLYKHVQTHRQKRKQQEIEQFW